MTLNTGTAYAIALMPRLSVARLAFPQEMFPIARKIPAAEAITIPLTDMPTPSTDASPTAARRDTKLAIR